MAQNVADPEGWIAEHLRDAQESFVEFAQHVYEDGVLDRKTKELIAAATSSIGRCPHCTEGHLEGARQAGASDEEIAEALGVAWAQGSGTQVFWMKEVFDDLLGADWREKYVPDADAAFWDFKSTLFDDGSLGRKTKELIAVAVSCQLRCRHCTKSHMESAMEVGATDAEVAEALAVLWVIGGGTHVVWNKEGFEKHLGGNPDRAT